MNVDLYNFVSALNCVLAQRLVRRICVHCKRPATASDRLLDDSGLEPDRYRDFVFYEGAGLHRVQRHRLPGADRHRRAAQPVGQHPAADHRSPVGGRDQARRQGRGHALPARVGAPEGLRRGDHAARHQQGDLRRMSWARLLTSPPPTTSWLLDSYGRRGAPARPQGRRAVGRRDDAAGVFEVGPVGLQSVDRRKLVALLGSIHSRLEGARRAARRGADRLDPQLRAVVSRAAAPAAGAGAGRAVAAQEAPAGAPDRAADVARQSRSERRRAVHARGGRAGACARGGRGGVPRGRGRARHDHGPDLRAGREPRPGRLACWCSRSRDSCRCS